MPRAIKITAALLIVSALVGGMIALAGPAKQPPTELYVRTLPAGATVLVDGKHVGKSDDLFEVDPGVRKVKVELDGYEPASKEVIIPATRIERVVFELEKCPGSSRVSAETDSQSTFVNVLEKAKMEYDSLREAYHKKDWPTVDQHSSKLSNLLRAEVVSAVILPRSPLKKIPGESNKSMEPARRKAETMHSEIKSHFRYRRDLEILCTTLQGIVKSADALHNSIHDGKFEQAPDRYAEIQKHWKYLSHLISTKIPGVLLDGNILTNSGAEHGGKTPDAWKHEAAIPGVKYSWDKNIAFEGEASLFIEKTAQRYFPIASWSQTVPRKGNAPALELSAQVKAEKMTKAVLDVVFLDKNGKWISHKWAAYIGSKKQGQPPATHDWKKYSGKVDIPPGTAKMVIGLQDYGPGKVWFDDVCVKELKEKVEHSTHHENSKPAVKPPSEKNNPETKSGGSADPKSLAVVEAVRRSGYVDVLGNVNAEYDSLVSAYEKKDWLAVDKHSNALYILLEDEVKYTLRLYFEWLDINKKEPNENRQLTESAHRKAEHMCRAIGLQFQRPNELGRTQALLRSVVDFSSELYDHVCNGKTGQLPEDYAALLRSWKKSLDDVSKKLPVLTEQERVAFETILLADNILPNSGAEHGGKTPDRWEQGAAIEGVKYSWDKKVAFEGKASLCIEKTAPGFFPIASWSQTVEQNGEAPSIELSAQVKAEKVSRAVLDVIFLDKYGRWISHKWAAYIGSEQQLGQPPVDHDWKKYTGKVDIPPGTAKLVVGLQVYGPGKVWFDDVRLVEVKQQTGNVTSRENSINIDKSHALMKKVTLPKAGKPDAKTILDLASNETLGVKGSLKDLDDFSQFTKSGKGDLLFDRFLGCLRGDKAKMWDGKSFVAMSPDAKVQDLTTYKLPSVPCRLLITTAEKKHFDVTILSVTDEGGLNLEYHEADPSLVPKEGKNEDSAPQGNSTSADKPQPEKAASKALIELVEDFFRHNFRDVTTRKTIEWGNLKKHSNGNRSIRYKYLATFHANKEKVVVNQVFTFDVDGKFVDYKNVMGANEEGKPEVKVQRRAVGKKVADFPEKVDLSTPESAWAAFHRAYGRMDVEALAKVVSGKPGPAQFERMERIWKESEPEELAIYNKALLEAECVEVLTYHEELAGVISHLPFPPGKGRHPYSRRSFVLINGKWKSRGEDRCPTLEAARAGFEKKKDLMWEQFRHRLRREH